MADSNDFICQDCSEEFSDANAEDLADEDDEDDLDEDESTFIVINPDEALKHSKEFDKDKNP
jgi:hypothetical protein